MRFHIHAYIYLDARKKTIFTFSFPVTLTFDLLNLKFALPVTLVRSCLHQIWSYGFPITSKLYVCDRRTNGVQRSYRGPYNNDIASSKGYIQCESKNPPPPRGPDNISFFSQTVDNLYSIFLHTY